MVFLVAEEAGHHLRSPPQPALYARFSSDLQRDASIEDQIRSCRDYAAGPESIQ